MDDNRPLVVRQKEFSDTLLSLVNNSGLPAFLMKDTLRCTLIQIEYLAQKEFEEEYAKFNEEGDKEDAGC